MTFRVSQTCSLKNLIISKPGITSPHHFHVGVEIHVHFNRPGHRSNLTIREENSPVGDVGAQSASSRNLKISGYLSTISSTKTLYFDSDPVYEDY
jgi:hypothetical protein